MSEIIKRETTTIATVGERDPFDAFADATAPQNIIGKLLRFNKGDFFAGEDDEEIKPGTVFTAGIDELATGWVHWQDRKPIETIMFLVRLNQVIPRRDTLGDTDRSLWECDNKGQPRDPWSLTSYLPLLGHNDGLLYTFATSSKGGLQTLGKLSRSYARRRRQFPDVLPVIQLAVDSYPHEDYGRVKYPVFKLMGWELKERFTQALREAGLTSAETEPVPQAAPAKPVSLTEHRKAAGQGAAATQPSKVSRPDVTIKPKPTPIGEDLDDDVPFN